MLDIPAAVIDTHALLWYLSGDLRLSTIARQFFDEVNNSDRYVAISAITFIEVIYLVEKNRIRSTSYEDITAEIRRPDSIFKIIDVSHKIADTLRSVSRDEIPEMPDRIIAATALSLNVPVITRDRLILASSIPTIW